MAQIQAERETETFYWAALNGVSGMDAALFSRLTGHFGSPRAVWKAAPEALRDSGTLTPANLEHLLEAREKFQPEDFEKTTGKFNRMWTLEDDAYPELLRGIPDPPPVLYGRGVWADADRAAVAIVGTRRATGYGRDLARDLAAGLARAGVTVVSGLAIGIDTAAHLGALHAGGRTIAVLGSGFDNIYPQNNINLADDIAKSGLVLSEFAPHVGPDKWNFPRRNRVISGLTLGTVVVECAENSGAMITAEFALKQGRKVFAAPGDVNRQGSRGPHALLRRGAHLVESAEDIRAALGLGGGAQRELPMETALDGREKDVYAALAETPRSFDEMCAALALTASEAASVLMMLEMKGLIRQLPGKIFVRER